MFYQEGLGMSYFWEKKTEGEYSREDDETISNVLSELERKPVTYRDEGHVFGLKTWMSNNVDSMERFIFSCDRLRKSYKKRLREIFNLQENLQKLAGSSEVVDLKECYKLGLYQDKFRGIVISKEHADKLSEIIIEALEDSRKDGFKHGSNMLVRLSNGDMSILNFEKGAENNK
jgi:hypothetical protein